MLYQRLFFVLFLFSIIIMGCKKDISKKECQQLKEALQSDNTEAAKTIITHFINNLPSKNYTQQNLDKLAASLSGECTLTARVLCFSCIKTLPEQTEIRISAIIQGTQLYKTIDISYSPGNMIEFVNMHD